MIRSNASGGMSGLYATVTGWSGTQPSRSGSSESPGSSLRSALKTRWIVEIATLVASGIGPRLIRLTL
jgi:hypothetical protein